VGGGNGVCVGETVIDGVFLIRIVGIRVAFGEEVGEGFIIPLQEDDKNINKQNVSCIE
jgi:hypothetical protein